MKCMFVVVDFTWGFFKVSLRWKELETLFGHMHFRSNYIYTHDDNKLKPIIWTTILGRTHPVGKIRCIDVDVTSE